MTGAARELPWQRSTIWDPRVPGVLSVIALITSTTCAPQVRDLGRRIYL